MGLSEPERIKNVLQGLSRFRCSLLKLIAYLDEEMNFYENYHGSRVIEETVAAVDEILGLMCRNMDCNPYYWIVGESDGGYRSHYSSGDHLDRDRVLDLDDFPSDVVENYSLVKFAELLTEGSFHRQNRFIALAYAHWWSAQEWIPSIIYYFDRYDDKLFKHVGVKFSRLVGRFVADKNEILKGHLGDDCGVDRDAWLVEESLLCKYNIYLTEKDKLEHKEINSRRLKKKVFKFDHNKLIERIGKMTMKEVYDYIHAERSRKFEESRKNENENSEEPKTEGLLTGLQEIRDKMKTELSLRKKRRE